MLSQAAARGVQLYLLPVLLSSYLLTVPSPDMAQHGVSQHVVTGQPQQVTLLALHQVVLGPGQVPQLPVLLLPGVEMIH